MGVGWTLESVSVGTCWAHLGLRNSTGQKDGQHFTSDSNSNLCWAHLYSLGSPKKVKRPALLPMGTGTVNSFSKDNNRLRLFYLSRRTKAVFLYMIWVRNARQAQASGPRCMFTCLFGPSMEAERTRTQAASHSINWATAASKFGRCRLLPAEHAPPATWPLWQGECFAHFLRARTHLPASTRLAWLHPNRWHLGGVTREWLPTSLPAASSVPTMYDPQLRIHHAAELT